MINKYYRVTYKDIGIYEALKLKIWNSNNSFKKNDWENFKNSNDVKWLKVPDTYNIDNYSYFTEQGFKTFMERTYPLIIKYLDEENIKIHDYLLDNKNVKIIYCDSDQIVIEK